MSQFSLVTSLFEVTRENILNKFLPQILWHSYCPVCNKFVIISCCFCLTINLSWLLINDFISKLKAWEIYFLDLIYVLIDNQHQTIINTSIVDWSIRCTLLSRAYYHYLFIIALYLLLTACRAEIAIITMQMDFRGVYLKMLLKKIRSNQEYSW